MDIATPEATQASPEIGQTQTPRTETANAKPLSEKVKGILSIFKKDQADIASNPDKVLQEIAEGEAGSEAPLPQVENETNENPYKNMTPSQLNEEFKGLISLFPTSEALKKYGSVPLRNSNGASVKSPLNSTEKQNRSANDRGVIFNQLRSLAPYMKLTGPGLDYLFHMLDTEFDIGIKEPLPSEPVEETLMRTNGDFANIIDALNPQSGGPFDESYAKPLEWKMFKLFQERSAGAHKNHFLGILKKNGFEKKWANALADKDTRPEIAKQPTAIPVSTALEPATAS